MTGRQKPPQEEKKFGSPLKCKKIEEKLKKTPRNPKLKRLNTPDTKTKSQRKPKFNADKHKKIFNFFEMKTTYRGASPPRNLPPMNCLDHPYCLGISWQLESRGSEIQNPPSLAENSREIRNNPMEAQFGNSGNEGLAAAENKKKVKKQTQT